MLNFDSVALTKVFKNVCEFMNIALTLFDNNQNNIFSYTKNPYDICKKICVVKEIDDKCKACNHNALTQAFQKREPYIYMCHMGMTEAVMPIIQNNNIIGYIMLGKIAEAKNIPYLKQQIQHYCKKYGLSEAELISDVDKIPLLSHETIFTCTNILNMLTSYILDNHIIKPEVPSLSIQIDNYIAENLNGDLSVKAICDFCQISPSMLYRTAVANYGCSISEYIKKRRIKEAKVLLRTPLNITQLAEAVGFSDANYFIKIFKKETGTTPLKYKKSLTQ